MNTQIIDRLVLNDGLYNYNTKYIDQYENREVELIDSNTISFKTTKLYNTTYTWFGYYLNPGSYTLTFDILSDIDIHTPFIKVCYPDKRYNISTIKANIWESISTTIQIPNSSNFMIFDFHIGQLLNLQVRNISFIKTPLCKIMNLYAPDKGSNIIKSWHNYTEYYYMLFNKIRLDNIRLFQLGIRQNGKYLHGWSEFFPNSKCFGADSDTDILFNTDRINTFYCDQTNVSSIKSMWDHDNLTEEFDIIIDDGYNTFPANVRFFENSIHKLKDGGYYIIEDIQNNQKSYFISKIEEWKELYPNIIFRLIEIPSGINTVDNNLLIAYKRQIQNIHLMMCSHGEPYDSVKKLTIDTVRKHSKRNIIIHDYTFDRIQNSDWFSKIKDLPNIYRNGSRDGYYNSYKIFCTLDVYKLIGDNDVLLYLDSSRHHQEGCTESIDTLCEMALEKGFIAGSIGNNTMNREFQLCDTFEMWKKILPECNENVLSSPHILNSWYALSKNKINDAFLNDWAYWSLYTDNEFIEPLITLHHPVDQTIFTVLAHKYNLSVFFDRNRDHLINKDKNSALRVMNESKNKYDLFIPISDCTPL